MSTPVRSVMGLWSRRPGVDFGCGIAAAGGYFILHQIEIGPTIVLDGFGRSTVYIAVLIFGSALLAFGMTLVAIILAITPGPRLQAILKYRSNELRRAMVAELWNLLALVTISTVALAFDGVGNSNRLVRYLVVVTTVAALSATSRLIDLFGGLLANVGADRKTGDAEPLRPIDLPRAG